MIYVLVKKPVVANSKEYSVGELLCFGEKEKAKAEQMVQQGFGEFLDTGKELDKTMKVVKENFPDAVFETKAFLSAYATLLLKGLSNPIGLVFVGNPSNIKTTVISFGYNLEGITYKSDSFSPKAFVSHAANLKEEKLQDIDLLPKIKDKIFLIPEMAPIFSKKPEDLMENIGVMTRLFDGEGLETDSGARGHRGYVGKHLFVMIGATTPLTWRIWDVLGKLGNRWLFVNVNRSEKSEEELILLLKNQEYLNKIFRARQAVHSFLKNLFFVHDRYSIDWDTKKDDIEVLRFIVKACNLLRKLRAPLQIWESKKGDSEETSFEYSTPLIEGPERVLNIMAYLAKGHAIIHGRNYLTKEDLSLVFRTALSSMPKDRSDLFQLLIDSNGYISTSEIMSKMNVSRQKALRIMNTLKVLGIVEIKTDDSDEGEAGRKEYVLAMKEEFRWILSEEVKVHFNGGQTKL